MGGDVVHLGLLALEGEELPSGCVDPLAITASVGA